VIFTRRHVAFAGQRLSAKFRLESETTFNRPKRVSVASEITEDQ
jgi:hypothetical protein